MLSSLLFTLAFPFLKSCAPEKKDVATETEITKAAADIKETQTAPESKAEDKNETKDQKSEKKTESGKDGLFSLLDLEPKNEKLGEYQDVSTKKIVPVTRLDVIEHLKAIGFDLSIAQPKSKIKEIEMQAAAFLVVMNYILPIAKEAGIENELAERIKFMASQLIFGRYMEKRVMDKINMETVRQEAITEVQNKRKGEYCYDIFVTVTKSADKAKEVIGKIQDIHNKQSDSLIKDLEALAEETHKDIDEKELKHPTLIASKRTNGWLLPREMLMQESGASGQDGKSGDLVFLIKELIVQFLGKEISDQIVGRNGKTFLKTNKVFAEPFKFDGHYLVVYVVNAKPFDKLGRLVEMFATEELRRIMPKKQKDAQFAIIKEIYEKNKGAMKLVGPDGKEAPIPEKVLQMLGYSM